MAWDRFDVESAGLEPGKLDPLAVEAMKEIGIDISQNKTKSAFDFYKQGKRYDYVINVCDELQVSQCPVFPGAVMLMLVKGCLKTQSWFMLPEGRLSQSPL